VNIERVGNLVIIIIITVDFVVKSSVPSLMTCWNHVLSLFPWFWCKVCNKPGRERFVPLPVLHVECSCRWCRIKGKRQQRKDWKERRERWEIEIDQRGYCT